MTEGGAQQCVVCGARIEKPHWPNAWEKSLGMRPCCSITCGANYDPDRDWIPGSRPDPAPPQEEVRLLAGAGQRLAAGDAGHMIARDLLCGGVDPSQVRHILQTHAAVASRGRAESKAFSLMTFLGGKIWRSSDPREPRGLIGALEELDRWERHFPR